MTCTQSREVHDHELIGTRESRGDEQTAGLAHQKLSFDDSYSSCQSVFVHEFTPCSHNDALT